MGQGCGGGGWGHVLSAGGREVGLEPRVGVGPGGGRALRFDYPLPSHGGGGGGGHCLF